MGCHLYKGTAPVQMSNNPSAKEFAKSMVKVQEEVGSALKKATDDMTRYYDKKHSKSREYKAGDLVLLEGINITSDRPMKKLDDKHFGPFKVISKVSASSYKLDIPKSWKNIHNVFNEVLLTPYIEPKLPGQPNFPRPPPENVKGLEEEYKVEEIFDSCKKGRGVIYKVKWKGYGPHEWTWEPVGNLSNAKEAIDDFHKKFPRKPKSKSIK